MPHLLQQKTAAHRQMEMQLHLQMVMQGVHSYALLFCADLLVCNNKPGVTGILELCSLDEPDFMKEPPHGAEVSCAICCMAMLSAIKSHTTTACCRFLLVGCQEAPLRSRSRNMRQKWDL